MPTLLLTDRFIDTLKPPPSRIEYHDTHTRGLVLRVTPSGVFTWTLRYRSRNGRTQRLTLGSYDDLSLKQARKQAEIQRGKVAGGADPAKEKQAERRAAALGETIADLAKEYMAKHARAKKRSWQEDQRILDADVLPRWRTLKVKELTRRDVRALLNSIVERGSPIAANRCLAVVRKMLNFAVAHDWIDASPATLIEKPGAEHSRERVLTDPEIRLVWEGAARERPILRDLTRLRFLTLQRGKELASLRWVDIDGHWITLPGSVTKNGQAHRVYLSKPARAILDGIPRIDGCEWVFPGGKSDSRSRPLGDEKKAGTRIRDWALAQLQAVDPSITGFDFRLHDMRRTGSTRMAAAGVPQADIAKVLNHVDGGPRATQVYNRYQYDREKQIALETWARILTRILDEQPQAGDVVPFARA